MKKMEHQYFGQLNLATADDVDVIWEKEIQGIDTCLWLEKNVELSAGRLDPYAQFLENIDDKIKEARKALIAYLKDDSEQPHIAMDFMIAPDESDEILCVKFGEDAKIIAIDWES